MEESIRIYLEHESESNGCALKYLRSDLNMHGHYGEYLNIFLSRSIKDRTVGNYKQALECLLRFCMNGGFDVQHLSESIFLFWKRWLVESSGLADSTINTYIISVKSYYRSYCGSLGIDDVTVGLRMLELEEEFRRDPINLTEMKMIINAVRVYKPNGKELTDISVRNVAMMYILCSTGVRQMVIENMKWCDIVQREVRLENKEIEFRNYLRYKKKSRDDIYGTVPLSYDCFKALMDWKLRVERLCGADGVDSKYPIFFSLSSVPTCKFYGIPNKMNNSSIRGIVTKAMRDGNVYVKGQKTPHCIRHGFATEILRKTGDKDLVRKLVGHAFAATTDMYVKMEDKNRQFLAVNNTIDLKV